MSDGRGGARPGAGRKPAGYEPPDDMKRLTKAKADKEEAMAKIRAMEVKEKAGQLVSVADVRKTWAEAAATAKNRLLALPSRVSPLVSRETDLRKIEDLLTQHINEVLAELASNAKKDAT
jgi:phage terminase Nu1 subunit (DNA packaging protein)